MVTDVQKYNRIVEGPIVVTVRKFDRHEYAGMGEKVAFLEGSPENLASFISQNTDQYLLCDRGGFPMVYCNNRSYRPAKHYADYPHGQEVLASIGELVQNGRWVRDFIEEPILLSFSRFLDIMNVADELEVPMWGAVPEDAIERVRTKPVLYFMSRSDIPEEEDEDFMLTSSSSGFIEDWGL